MTNKKLVPEIQELIETAIDDVMEQYLVNNKIIYESESERAKSYFWDVTERHRAWSRSSQCMVPICPNPTVKRSHTIPRSMSLTTIDEGGKLLMPDFDHRLGELGMKHVSTAVASTFPGFCVTHEQLFQQFESNGDIASDVDLLRQAYRSACRELYRAQFIVSSHETMLLSYCEERDAGLLRLVREKLAQSGHDYLCTKGSLTYSSDPLIDGANERLNSTRELIIRLQDGIIPALEMAVFQKDESGISIRAFAINLEIPVALSGCGNFVASIDGQMREVSVIISVIPSSNQSLVMIVGSAFDDDLIQVYWNKWINNGNGLTMLSMIESWMVNGTDQWYLRPSVWNTLPKHRKDAILQAVIECKQNIGHEFGMSIFDELRWKLLDMLAVADHGADQEAYERFVENQRTKLT